MGNYEERDYKDIPGTIVFDLQTCVKGYELNKFCDTLNRPEAREAFLADEEEYMSRFPKLSEEMKDGIRRKDLNYLLALGGNIYYLWKIAATLGLHMQQAGAMMSEPQVTTEEFQQMMIDGGRPIEGNRSIKENEEKKMAKIIGGIGTSHIPTIMLKMDNKEMTGPYWEPFNEGIKPLRAWMKEKKPDVCIIVYNDHGSNFSLKNVIPFGIGIADEYLPADEGYGRRKVPTFKGDAKLSCHLAEHFNEKEFDVAMSFELDVDHGFSVPASLSFGEDLEEWPCKFIPIYVGVVQYPQPKGNRCYNLGKAIREAIESYPEDINVAIMGTGGLSHQLQGPRAGLINVDYDTWWLDNLVKDPESIKDISLTELIRETGSEGAEAIMWLTMRGALGKDVDEVYRFMHVPISNTNYSLTIMEPKDN